MLKTLGTFVLAIFLCSSLKAQKLGTTTCTALVNRNDCSWATSAFQVSRDNKIFNRVDIVIADPDEFERQKSQIDADMTRRFKNGETGLLGMPLLSGEDEGFVLILLSEKGAGGLRSIDKVVVSVKAFYKLELESDGKPSKTTHFDSNSAVILAQKINGYVTGWFFAHLSMVG